MPALRDGSISSVPGALIPKLAIHCRDLWCELRNQRSSSNYRFL